MKHLQLIPTASLSEAEWQSLRLSFVRKGMVGGSDAGTLLGLNQYKSPINMFYQAVGVGDLPNIMNAAMLHGKQLEDYVAKCWQYYDGTDEGWVANTLADNKIKRYKKLKAIAVNPDYPFLFANLDGIITKHPDRKGRGILEIKTISGFAADSYEAGIPPGYYAQVQHYMLVTGFPYAEICYLKDGRQLGVVTFERDEEIQNRILFEAGQFNKRVEMARAEIDLLANNKDEELQIASKYEPDADSSDAFNQFLSEKHKARAEEITIHGTDLHEDWANEYQSLSAQIKEIEPEKQLLQNKLKQAMEKEGASVMLLPSGGKITWRKQFQVKL